MRNITFLILLLFIFCSSGFADELVFKSGARLNGQFVKLEGGELTFTSEEVGEVTVKLAEVESFTSDAPAKFVFKDGTVITSKVLGVEAGQVTLEKTQLLASGKYNLSEVTAINPPAKPPVKWTGSLSAGLTSTHGNTFAESGSISFDALRRAEKDRASVYARYLVSRTEDSATGDKRTTQESFTFGGKYDYFFSKKLYGFLDGNFKKDHIADLDRRIIMGVGAGYQWIESEEMNFSSDLGVSELCEQYTRHEEITKSDELSARFGYHFDRELYKGFDFIHNLNYYPSATGTFSDYFLSTDAEIRLALTESMFGSFKAILDYDSTPAPGIGKTDTKYILSVGWTF